MTKYSMSPSRVLAKLRRGECVSCFKVNMGECAPVEIAGLAGYDCVWLDMEHVPTDWDVIEKQILAAKANVMDSMIRVKRGNYSNYIHPLELDATGIMVPHVMSVADCKDVARMTRFHPVGRRPIDGGNQDGMFCRIPMTEYVEQANRERFVCVQIEDPEPMEELEGICAVDGIDMLFFGALDFSHGSGILAQWDHPTIVETRRQIGQTARAYGKFAGAAATPEHAPALIEMGYQFLVFGADVLAINEYCDSMLQRFRDTLRTTPEETAIAIPSISGRAAGGTVG